MSIQEQIALENNEAFVGKNLRVIVDRCEGDYWICRSEFDSPDVDNEVLVPANAPMRIGNFYSVQIVDAMEHDLMAKYLE